jgi:hypothetical protein
VWGNIQAVCHICAAGLFTYLYIEKYPPLGKWKFQPLSFGENYETGKRKIIKYVRKKKKDKG